MGKRYETAQYISTARSREIIRQYVHMFHGDTPNKDEYLFYSNYNGNRHKLSPEAINKRLKIYARLAHATCSEMPEIYIVTIYVLPELHIG